MIDASASLAAVPSAPADSALVDRIRSGDREALTALIDELYPSMLRLASAILHDTADAPDVVQDTWLSFVTSLASFEGRSSLKTWVLRILVNRARSVAARAGRTVAMGEMASLEGELSDEPTVAPHRFTAIGRWRAPVKSWSDDPEWQLVRKQLGGLLEDELGRLSEGQRAVVTLRDIEGLSSAEACAVLELSESNQRVLLHRGRARLRAAIERARGGTIESEVRP